MYNNNRPSGGGNSFNRFGGKPSFGGPRRFGAPSRFGAPKRGRFSGSKIDTNKYIKKAEDFVKNEDTQTTNMFENFGLNDILLKNILDKGFLKPTPIQDQVIGEVLKGRDVLGIANTGTGKTAAFAIPLINMILENPNKRVIILAPTRELAMQIKQEIRSFTPGLKIYIALAIGGAFIREQIIDCRRGPHIIIGTPGRIKDLGERRAINFSGLDTLVLDEVDRMLDMGFIDDIRHIVNQINGKRQTLFFSATVDRKIEALINTFLVDPVRVSVKTSDSSSHVEQNIVRVARNFKQDKLVELLSKEEFKKVLVFGGTKIMVQRISETLQQRGFRADAIHGDKPQHKRQRVLAAFKMDEIKILVATDVAARGLDVADITHVINYDQPNNYDDYCHRIGRTGRGDKKGYALTFVE